MTVDEKEVSMTWDGKKVSMHKSNHWLNATEILKSAGKSKHQVMRQHTEVQVEKVNRGTHRHGCDAFELIDALSPLLEFPCRTAIPKESFPNGPC